MRRRQFKAMRQCKQCRLVINASLQLLEVAPPGDQIYSQFKWCQVMVKFRTLYRQCGNASDSSGTIWWPNLELMQVVPSGGQICNLCNDLLILAKIISNYFQSENLFKLETLYPGSVVPLAMFFHMKRQSVHLSI